VRASALLAGLFALVLAAIVGPGVAGLAALDWRGGRWDAPWHLSPWPLVVGSVSTVALAVALAAPVAVATATRLALARRSVPAPLQVAGFLPSVVFGFLALEDLVVPLSAVVPGTGFGVAAAAVLLAAMVLPVLVVALAPALAGVAERLTDEGRALGLGDRTLGRLLWRAGRREVAAGLAFGAVRCLGESVAAAMVLGGGVGWPRLFGPSETLAAVLVSEGPGVPPGGAWASALAAVGLLLVALGAAIDAAGGGGRR
jgi:phosphate transport system permease protein